MRKNIHQIKELRFAAKAEASKWNRANADIARATARRDTALWDFIRCAVKLGRAKNLKSAPRLRRLISKLNEGLDSKAVSRYALIVRAVIKLKPKGVRIRDWIKSHGGISRFKLGSKQKRAR
jgi:hypothetical protein